MSDKKEITDLLKEMFEAEKEYGCGYYNDYSWLIPYCKLRKKVGMGDYYDDEMIMNETTNPQASPGA